MRGCAEKTPRDIIEDPSRGMEGANFYVAPIYGVFYDAETGEQRKVIIGQHNYCDATTIEELVDALGWFTELRFALKVSYDDLGTAIEWPPEASLFGRDATSAFLYHDEGGEKGEHIFPGNNELRWFVLESLVETLGQHAPGLHYSMGGGKDLLLEGLTPLDTFPVDKLYEGRPVDAG